MDRVDKMREVIFSNKSSIEKAEEITSAPLAALELIKQQQDQIKQRESYNLQLNDYIRSQADYEIIIDKLADIRNLFTDEDEKAEGHSMDDMVGSPYAVACYTEDKLKRQQKQIERHRKALNYVDTWAKGDMREIARKALGGDD